MMKYLFGCLGLQFSSRLSLFTDSLVDTGISFLFIGVDVDEVTFELSSVVKRQTYTDMNVNLQLQDQFDGFWVRVVTATCSWFKHKLYLYLFSNPYFFYTLFNICEKLIEIYVACLNYNF